MNGQLSKLNETVSELRKQVKDLTAEKDQLASQSTAATTDSNVEVEALKSQLSSITQEKDSAAKLLAEELERSAKAIADHNAALVALREERDKLLAEKASDPGGDASAVESLDVAQLRQQLETEKAELSKARDEALARAKSAEERVAKALNDARNVRLQNEKFQERMKENNERRFAADEKLAALVEKHKQEQEEAVAAATAKLRSELQAPETDALKLAAFRHGEELRMLEAKLVAKHEEELSAVIEKARRDAAASASPGEDKKSTEEQEQALKSATERGRMESATKLKLKDSMLLKAQTNVKNLEAQIKAWREAGLIPADTPTVPLAAAANPAKPAVSIPAKPVPVASTSASSPAAAVAGSSASATSATLPRKPSVNVTAGANATEASARGARGGVRGTRGAGRGVARGGASRGGAPAALAQAVANNSADSVSIIGAAGKRNREEADGPDSLAKRIKPAEGAGKPVVVRRDRIPITNPTPPT
ncbi:hypothetical protein DFH11DRAFT_1067215 [Phellopilus nigrolimitatus]|nr:hypothetical protein DFH11DRAFT_1067215 [Phellopilus nigrolimitatus]